MTILFKKVKLLIIGLIIAGIGFTDIVAFASVVEDSAITAEVKKKLVEEKDIPAAIEVVTKDRIVSLKGEVDTHLQAHKAIELASSVDKVIDVIDSDLKVKESKSIMTDAIITAKVKGKITHLYINKKIASGYELHVESTNKEVHIFGHVSRAADVDTVVAAAKEVKGVGSVKTNITVK